MNGARTIFRRKGYLLTALAAAVLLAASSGTAWAQTPSVDFEDTSVTVREGAVDPATNDTGNPHVSVNVIVSGLPSGAIGTSSAGVDTPRREAIKVLGTLTFSVAQSAAGSQIGLVVEEVDGDPGTSVALSGSPDADDALKNPLEKALELDDKIRLTLSTALPEEETNWNDESFTVSVTSNSSRVVNIGRPLQGTIKDKHWTPVASFGESSTIRLTEGSERELKVSVGAPKNNRNPNRPTIPADSALIVDVSPADAFTVFGEPDVAVSNCAASPTPVFIRAAEAGTQTYRNGKLTLNNLDVLFGATAAGAAPQTFTLVACPEKGDFGDFTITLSFNEKSLMTVDAGSVTAGPSLMIEVRNDDAVPTLSFTPTDVTIDEGDSVSTVLLAEGENASQVGMVKLMVEGDAMVDLYLDGEMLEEMDGYVMVDLGGSTKVRLTAMSLSDPDLMDGYTAYKAWKLMEGATDGAAISEDYWFRVDVIGSTAVPALPLVGQLLLALFLMAGGARLYRRRQG